MTDNPELLILAFLILALLIAPSLLRKLWKSLHSAHQKPSQPASTTKEKTETSRRTTPTEVEHGGGGNSAPVSSDDLVFLVRELASIGRDLKQTADTIKHEAVQMIDDGLSPLRVFICSRQEELSAERDAVEDAIKSIEITRPWRFENAPSTSEPPQNVYRRQVELCDVFVLVLGRDISTAVLEEHEVALEKKQNRLYFVKRCERTAAAQRFLEQILSGVTYKEFDSVEELKKAVLISLWGLLVDSVRTRNNDLRLTLVDVSTLLLVAQQLELQSDDRVADLRQVTDDEHDERRAHLVDSTGAVPPPIENHDDEGHPGPRQEWITSERKYCPREKFYRVFVRKADTGMVRSSGLFSKEDLTDVEQWECSSCGVLLLGVPCRVCGRSPVMYKKVWLSERYRPECPHCGASWRTSWTP